jgi:hypothetical protein
VEARTIPVVIRNRPQDPFADKERVASIVGTLSASVHSPRVFFPLTNMSRVHNAHMFASGWQTIRALMYEVDKPSSDAVTTEIAVNEAYREKYLVLLDFVDTIIDATYANVQVLLTTTRKTLVTAANCTLWQQQSPSALQEVLQASHRRSLGRTDDAVRLDRDPGRVPFLP